MMMTSEFWASISWILGWTYFTCWSISFYPQILLNWQRKSVMGLSKDFVVLNVWGFTCMVVYHSTMYWSPTIQKEYRQANHGEPNLVRLNDVAFSWHALLLSLVTLAQVVFYRRRSRSPDGYQPCREQEEGVEEEEEEEETIPDSWDTTRVQSLPGPWEHFCMCTHHLARMFIATTMLIAVVLLGLACYFHVVSYLAVVNYLSNVKIFTSLLKYCPQVYLNYRRKSTVGWSIVNILLDGTGGILSLAQLLLDAWRLDRWDGVRGNGVKLGLAVLTLSFDAVFVAQHYGCYPEESRTRIQSSRSRYRSGTATSAGGTASTSGQHVQ